MLLTSNTLYEISKHSSKTLRLADFMVKSGNKLLQSKLSTLTEDSSEIDLIESFNKDYSETANKIVDMHQLLSTVNDDDIVLHLKGEKDLKVVFGDKYNPLNKTIEFPFGVIDLKNDLSKEQVVEFMMKNILDISVDEYKELFKGRKNTFKHHSKELYSLDDKLEYLSSYSTRKMFEPVIDKLRNLVKSNIEFRKALSVEDKGVIDREITFERSMLDSVTKQSLYITKKNGISQWGTGFKREKKEEIETLNEVLKDHIYIEAIELGSGSSVDACIELVKEIEKLNINTPMRFVLKSRKLGNYEANGYYMSSQHIVSLDTKSPEAAIHEIVHAIDMSNPDIYNSKARNDLAKGLRSRMLADDSAPVLGKEPYSTKEIIARAGEVSYIFEKYDYNTEEETFEEFANRVRESQKQSHAFDLRIEPKIDRLIDKKELFFDVATMDKETVDELREYYKSYFRMSKDLPLKPIHSVEIQEHKAHKVVKEHKRFQKTPLSYINQSNIKEIMTDNEKLKVVDPAEIVTAMFENSTEIGRLKRKLTNKEVISQGKVFKDLSEWAFENDNFYVMSRIIENLYKVHSEVDYKEFAVFDYARKNKDFVLKIDVSEEAKVAEEKIRPIFKSEEILSSKDAEKFDKIIDDTINKPFLLRNEIASKSQESDNLIHINRKTGDLSDGSLNSTGYALRFGYALKMLVDTTNKDGDKIFNYFNKDDVSPYLATLQDKDNYKTLKYHVLKEHRREYTVDMIDNTLNSKGFLSVIDKSNGLDDLVDVSNRVDIKYSKTTNSLKSSYGVISDMNFTEVQHRAERGFPSHVSSRTNVGSSLLNNDVESLTISDLKAVIVDLPDYDQVQDEISKYKASFTETKSAVELRSENPLQSFLDNAKNQENDSVSLKEVQDKKRKSTNRLS